jgi:hypothetical protein
MKVTELPAGRTVKLTNECGGQAETEKWEVKDGGTWVSPDNNGGSQCWKFTCSSADIPKIEIFANKDCSGTPNPAGGYQPNANGACITLPGGDRKATCMSSTTDDFVKLEYFTPGQCQPSEVYFSMDMKYGACFQGQSVAKFGSDSLYGYQLETYSDAGLCTGTSTSTLPASDAAFAKDCCFKGAEVLSAGNCQYDAVTSSDLECLHFSTVGDEPVSGYLLPCAEGQVCGAASFKCSTCQEKDKIQHIGGCNFKGLADDPLLAKTCQDYKKKIGDAGISDWNCYTCDYNNCNNMTAEDAAFVKMVTTAGAVGGVLVVLVSIGCCWWCCARKKRAATVVPNTVIVMPPTAVKMTQGPQNPNLKPEDEVPGWKMSWSQPRQAPYWMNHTTGDIVWSKPANDRSVVAI